MTSGIFLMGDNISLEAFREYIEPIFQAKGCIVHDRMVVPYGRGNNIGILTSIVGDGDLEYGVNDVLIYTLERLHTENREQMKERNDSIIAIWANQIPHFNQFKIGESEKVFYCKTCGVYDSDDTASQMFSLIAQDYLLKGMESRVYEVTKQIRSLLEKKISDF